LHSFILHTTETMDEKQIPEEIKEEVDFSKQVIEIVIPEQEPVEPTQDEVIQKRKKDLQYKVALWTATTTEKSDLKLLIA